MAGRLQAKQIKHSDIDWTIILIVLLLAMIGMASLYLAFSDEMGATSSSALRKLVSQGVWWVVSGGIVFFLIHFDDDQMYRLAPFVYGLGILSLIAVLFLYSRELAVTAGAKSWFAFMGFTFQPSEVMKPAFILMLARVIASHNRQFPEHDIRTDWLLLFKMAFWLIPVVVLIALQNDLGTLLVFLAIFAGMVLVSGVTWKIILPVLGAAMTLGGSMIFMVTTTFGRHILGQLGFQSYQFSRIDAWLNPEQDTTNTGYQMWQALKAIGSGQLTGKGLNHIQVYVPVRESDMIFTVMGETLGFVGGLFLIALYFFLIYRMVRVTFETRNMFYAYVSTGVVMMILFHVFENIGMNIGLLPLTGIPLPFISQGGSSLLSNMIGVGMVLSMRYQQVNASFSESKGFDS